MKNKTLLLFIFAAVMMASCKKETGPSTPEGISATTLKVNSFIYESMNIFYLWNEEMPTIDYTTQSNSIDYFKNLLVTEDRFSYISDDYNGLIASLEGVEKSFGYNLALFKDQENNNQLIAVVNFIFPNSPASNAGLKRGDMITELNNQPITKENYMGLINSNTLTITFGDPVTKESFTKTLNRVEITMNPVHTSSILDVNGTKVGYLHYTGYMEKFNEDLKRLFTDFKNKNVTEMILDLRHNGGGDSKAIICLCSCLAPKSALESEEVIIRESYNKILTEQLGLEKTTFSKEYLPYNLDLKRIFILTSGETYSASEVTIVGLNPYMNVVTIGEKTGGKYTGMRLLRPYIDNNNNVDPEIANWCLLPIMSKYENKNGATAKGGIAPTYEENIYKLPFKELGSKDDHLVARAISILEGKSSYKVARSKSTTKEPLQIVDVISSEYGPIKQNIIMK